MPIAVALRLVCRNGSATLTTVPSMNAMLEARIVAARTHRPISVYCVFICGSKRLVDGDALLSKKLRPIFGDVQAVCQPDAKLTIDHDRRLVTKTHAGLNGRLVA